MWSFEGNIKKGPVQSLGGASGKQVKDKQLLLKKTQAARQKREELRRKHHAATQIQAFFRGCRARGNIVRILDFLFLFFTETKS